MTLILNGCSFLDARKKELMTNRVIAKDLPISDEAIIKKILEFKKSPFKDLYGNDDQKNLLKMARNEQIDTLLRMSDENYNYFKNFIYTDN